MFYLNFAFIVILNHNPHNLGAFWSLLLKVMSYLLQCNNMPTSELKLKQGNLHGNLKNKANK